MTSQVSGRMSRSALSAALIFVMAHWAVPASVSYAAAASAPAPVVMQFACVNTTSKAMSYATGTTCPKRSTSVSITVDSPTLACALVVDKAVKQVTSSSQCKSPNIFLTLPNLTSPTYFCASKSTNTLRYVTDPSQCTAKEFPVVVPIGDHPPVATNDGPYTTAEDMELSVPAPGVLSNDTDPDAGDTLTASLVAGPSHAASFTLHADGSFSYTPAADYNGSDSFTYKAKDSKNVLSVSAATVSLTITPVNDAPTASGQSVSTNEDTTKTITLSGTDVDDDALSFSVVDQPSHGTLGTLGAPNCSAVNTCTASVEYTPAANYNGSDSFTFRVNDGTGDSSPATVSITINAVNDPPVADAQSVSTDEDTAAVVMLTGSDVEDDNLTFSIVDGPSHGSLSAIGSPDCSSVNTCMAPVTYTPDANYNGSDSFTVKVNDGTADSTTAKVSITVNAVNDAPVADAQSVTTDEDTLQTITLSGSDVEGSSLTFAVADQPGHGTLGSIGTPSCVAGTCTADVDYTPDANYNGNDSFTFKTNDGTADSTTATVSITVTPVNDPPVATNDSYTTGGGTTFNKAAPGVLGNDTDVDGDTLTAVLVSGPSHSTSFTLNSDGSFDYTAAAGTTSDSFTYQANDGTANSNVATVTIAINAPPVASDQSVSTNEDTAKTITLSASDADDDALTFSVASGPSHGALGNIGTPDCTAVNTCTASVTYTPAANYNGDDSFTFTTNDGHTTSPAGTVSITVNAVNDAPTADGQSVTTNEDTLKTITLGGSDVDGNALSFSVVNGPPSHGTLGSIGTPSCTAGVCTADVDYTPAANYHGSDSFTFKVNDGTADSNTATISITITSVNDAPVASAQSVSTNEDMLKSITLSGTDVDDDALTFSIVSGPSHGTLGSIGTPDCSPVNTCTASVDYTPAADNNGDDSFTLKVNDGTVDSTTATVSITVIAVNDPPVLSNLESGNISFTEGDSATALTSNLTISDVDSTQLTGATVSISGGYQSGADVLAYTAPTGNPVTGSFNAGTGILTFSGTTTLADYQAALRAVTFGNASENPSSTTRTVSFQANDGAGAHNLSALVSRQITVTAVNDPPVNTVPSSQTVNEDTDLVFSSTNSNLISIVDVDAGSSAVKLSLDVLHGTLTFPVTTGLTFVDSTSNGSASVHVTGTISAINTALSGLKYKGTQDYNSTRGSETLTVVTNDQGNTGTGGALSDTDTVGITVTAVNDAPTAQAQTYGAGSIQTNMKRSLAAGSGLLQGANDPDTGDGSFTSVLSIASIKDTAETQSFTPSGGTITASITGVGDIVVTASDGSFTFDPAPGVTGTVSFKYTVCDNGNPTPSQCSTPATVTFTIAGPVIWFVDDSAAAGGDGRLSHPFQTLSAADAVDAASQRIFLYAGTYANGIALNAGEWLIGQGITGPADFDTLMSISPPTGTMARPAIGSGTQTVQGTVTLNTNAVVKALSLSSGSSTGLADPAGAITGVTVDQTSATTTTGTAVLLSDIAGTLTLTGLTTTGGTGANLTGSNGSATFTFTGVAISAGVNSGFVATGGGTVTVTGAGNSVTTTTGTALNVANTTIGASGLTFRSISANGAVNGIVLTATGSTGGLTVTGNGSAGTGGTIQNTTGPGISLTSTLSPSFDRMHITHTAGQGIAGTGVTNFWFTNGTIDNTGTGHAVDSSNIGFNTVLGGTTANVSGAVTITGNSLSTSYSHGIEIQNYSGTISDLNISGNSFTSDTVSGNANGSAILVDANDSGSSAASITKAELNANTIANFPGGAGILLQVVNATSGSPVGSAGTPGNATNVIQIHNNLIHGHGNATSTDEMGTQAINVSVSGHGKGNFDIDSNGTAANPLANMNGVAIACSAFGAVQVDCNVTNNVISPDNIFVNGQPGMAIGADGNGDTTAAPTLNSTISNNVVHQSNGNGILATNKADSGTARFKIQNNNVDAPLSGVRPGIRVESGNNTAGENTSVCLNISGNTSAGSGGTQGIGLRKQGTVSTTDSFAINGMAATSSPGVESYVNGLNPAGSGTLLISATSGFTNCSLP